MAMLCWGQEEGFQRTFFCNMQEKVMTDNFQKEYILRFCALFYTHTNNKQHEKMVLIPWKH